MSITSASDILVKRFDTYFPRSQKNMDLRKYIKEYYTFAFGERRGGFVPSIFVMFSKKSERYVTASTVTLNNSTIIPPVDQVHFLELVDFPPRDAEIVGSLRMKDFLGLLSAYLETIDKYPYLKLLPFNDDSAQTIIHKLKTSPLLQLAADGDLVGIDMLPTFEEQWELVRQNPKELWFRGHR